MAPLVQLVRRGLNWHTDRSPGHYVRVSWLLAVSCAPWLLVMGFAVVLGWSHDLASVAGAAAAVVALVVLLVATVPATVLRTGEPRDRPASRRQERRSKRG